MLENSVPVKLLIYSRAERGRKRFKGNNIYLPILVIIIVLIILTAGIAAGPMAYLEAQLALAKRESFSQIQFEYDDRYLANPFMGAVAPASLTTRFIEGTLVVGGFTWREIEKSWGEYDFSDAETANNYYYWTEEMNNQFMMSLTLDYPDLVREIGFDQVDIPLWMFEELKDEAEHKYRELLDGALEKEDAQLAAQYENSLYRIRNVEEILDEFNQTMAPLADIPGVGTFYRWSMQLPGGQVEYRGGFSPNYSSPLLLEYHNHALEAVAERYDNNHTFIILMTSVGHWGEPHTYYINDKEASGYYPPKEVEAQYEAKYAEYFKNTFISARAPREVARDHNFGLHNHAFGDPQHTYDWFVDYFRNGYTSYHTGESYPAMPDFWKRAPSGGEFLYTGDQRYLWDENIEATIQMARDTYLTWFNEAFFHMDEVAEKNQEYFFSKIGYRLMPENAAFSREVVAGYPIYLETVWANRGTAPFYYDWPLIVRLQNSTGENCFEVELGSASSILPGEQKEFTEFMHIPSQLEPGTYQLWTGLVNPESGNGEIKLTVRNRQVKGNFVYLGDVEISRGTLFSKLHFSTFKAFQKVIDLL